MESGIYWVRRRGYEGTPLLAYVRIYSNCVGTVEPINGLERSFDGSGFEILGTVSTEIIPIQASQELVCSHCGGSGVCETELHDGLVNCWRCSNA
jgi:hypothetical protein